MEGTLTELLNAATVFVRRPGGEILHWADGCRDLYGFAAEEAVGRSAMDLLRTEFTEPVDSIEATLLSSGQWRGRARRVGKSGRPIWTETVLLRRDTVSPGGPIVIDQSTDISDRVELEEKNALLARELQHRVRNILNVVQAIVRMSYPDAPADQRQKMQERIAALGEAVTVLQDSSWQQADMRAIVSEIGRGLGIGERIAANGPDLAIASDDTMGLSLALHELCTNALKYGALSRPGGRVALSWQSDPDDADVVRIRWKESGGPLVAPPSRTGFGTLLIRRAISGGSKRAVELDYAPDGVACELSVARAG